MAREVFRSLVRASGQYLGGEDGGGSNHGGCGKMRKVSRFGSYSVRTICGRCELVVRGPEESRTLGFLS